MHNLIERYKVEQAYEFKKWCKEIPTLHFKNEWDVKIIPPFGGAIVRFTIEYNNKKISCYLDCYNELGLYDGPYWEIYPYQDDVWRCDMMEAKELMKKIEEVLEGDA